MGDYFLILYVGYDFIVPIIDSVKGDMYGYRCGNDNRLWLYFREDPDTTGVLYGREYRHNALMGKASCYGAYWENVVSGEKIQIHGTSVMYQNLIKLSGLVYDLAEWYRSVVHSNGAIPTVCLFADCVESLGRKRFLKVMRDSGFDIRSFSLSFDSLAASYFIEDLSNYAEMSNNADGFGKRIVLINAAGPSVEISSLVSINGTFVTCSDIKKIPYEGENPVKRALVEHIVDEDNREHGFLNQDAVKNEYLYQMQYVDEWLKVAESTEDNSSFRISYHLSIDPEITYSRNISKSFIVRKQAELSRPMSEGLTQFCASLDSADVSAYLFCGDLFATERMYSILSRINPERSHYVSSEDISDILHIYLRNNPEVKEKLNDFDQIMARRVRELDSAKVWSVESGKILTLKRSFEELLPDFRARVESFKKKTDSTLASVDESLERSHFDEADASVDEMSVDENALKVFVQQTVGAILDNYQNNRRIFKKKLDYPFAQSTLSSVEENKAVIEHLVEVFEADRQRLSVKHSDIKGYRESYPEYCRLRKEFDHSTSLEEKRRLLGEMRGLTGEALPDDPTEVESVRVELSAEVEYSKRTLFAKPKPIRLHIRLDVLDSGVLPYNCALVLSDKPISCVECGCVRLDVPKGTERIFTADVDLPLKSAADNTKIIARLFVDKEKERMCDSSKVLSKTLYMNI